MCNKIITSYLIVICKKVRLIGSQDHEDHRVKIMENKLKKQIEFFFIYIYCDVYPLFIEKTDIN